MNFLRKMFVSLLLISSYLALGEPMKIADFFNEVRYENMEELCSRFYHKDIEFIDPIGKVNGIQAMINYYKHMYENVIDIEFISNNEFQRGDEKVFVWKMNLRHKRINSGSQISVDGISLIKYKDDKVIYHRDYFDPGVMIYENIPILGGVIKYIKKKAHGS